MRIAPIGTQIVQQGTKALTGSKDENFAQTLMDVMKEVNQSQNTAAETQKAFMTGQPVEYHDLMIAMEKASTSLDLTIQVRNKLLDAYTEITRMQV